MMWLPCTFLFVFSIQVSSASNICGLEEVPKCSITDYSCLENLASSARVWYQGPQAAGYLIQPIDPLIIDQLEFTFGSQKLTLNNVSISGLANSKINIEPTLRDHISKVTYKHNVVVQASDYTQEDLCSGDENDSNKPFIAKLSNLKTVGDVLISKKDRCDGTSHLSFELINRMEHSYGGGGATVQEGPKEIEMNFGDFAKKVAKVSSLQTLQRAIQLLSNVLISDIIKT